MARSKVWLKSDTCTETDQTGGCLLVQQDMCFGPQPSRDHVSIIIPGTVGGRNLERLQERAQVFETEVQSLNPRAVLTNPGVRLWRTLLTHQSLLISKAEKNPSLRFSEVPSNQDKMIQRQHLMSQHAWYLEGQRTCPSCLNWLKNLKTWLLEQNLLLVAHAELGGADYAGCLGE